MSQKVEIIGKKKLDKELERLRDAPEKVAQMTMRDVRKNGPAKIAAGVAKEYNVKATEVKSGKLGRYKIKGNAVDNLTIEYHGRLLTPVHFGMRPKAPKEYRMKWTIKRGGKPYSVSVNSITKKQWQNIGRNFTHQSTRNSPQSPIMLAHTGNTKEGGINYIPFQRPKQPGKLSEVQRRVSLPQMITHGEDGPLHDTVKQQLDSYVENRLSKYIEKYL